MNLKRKMSQKYMDDIQAYCQCDFIIYFCVWCKKWREKGGTHIFEDWNEDVWDYLDVSYHDWKNYKGKI